MIIHRVFNRRQAMLSVTISELTKGVADGRISIREVDQNHVRAIKRYTFENFDSQQLYFPPLVANIEGGTFEELSECQISMIDGSHRLKAFIQLEEMMMRSVNSDNEEETKRGNKLLYLLQNTKVALQLFEGFSQEDKDQLYIDLNTKGKKVSLSKRIAYDSRNHVNQITNYVLQLNEQLQTAGVELEKAAIIRPNNKKLLSLTQLRQIVGVFLTGKLMHSTAEMKFSPFMRTEEYIQLIHYWFDELFSICPVEVIGDDNQSIFSNYAFLAAVALLVNENIVSASLEVRERAIQERMAVLRSLELSRNNPIWELFAGEFKGKNGYYYLQNRPKNIETIMNWLKKKGR